MALLRQQAIQKDLLESLQRITATFVSFTTDTGCFNIVYYNSQTQIQIMQKAILAFASLFPPYSLVSSLASTQLYHLAAALPLDLSPDWHFAKKQLLKMGEGLTQQQEYQSQSEQLICGVILVKVLIKERAQESFRRLSALPLQFKMKLMQLVESVSRVLQTEDHYFQHLQFKVKQLELKNSVLQSQISLSNGKKQVALDFGGQFFSTVLPTASEKETLLAYTLQLQAQNIRLKKKFINQNEAPTQKIELSSPLQKLDRLEDQILARKQIEIEVLSSQVLELKKDIIVLRSRESSSLQGVSQTEEILVSTMGRLWQQNRRLRKQRVGGLLRG